MKKVIATCLVSASFAVSGLAFAATDSSSRTVDGSGFCQAGETMVDDNYGNECINSSEMKVSSDL